jgi:hypothetical protein
MTERKDTLVPVAIQTIVQILRAISPPTTLVHVGWGNGMGDLTQWTQWQVPNAFVIEAEERKAEACQAQGLALALGQTLEPPNKSWQTIHATLSTQNAEQTYHLASNPSESGLLPPDSLQHAWPHLQTVATQSVETRSLDELWQDISSQWPLTQSAGNTWLIIDCLPAADVLSGGGTVLQAAHVVCARSLLANRVSLSEQMRSAGWIEVGWVESQHPAFGHAWFTRDTALELGNAAKRHAQLEAERDALAKAKDAETAAKNQALAERDALVKVKDAETAAKSQALAERDALAKAKDAETAAKNQALAERDALVKVKDAETAAKSQALAERDALAKAKDAETVSANKAKTERDALAKEKQTMESKHKDSQERLQQLESANQDLHNRQHLQHEELVKAEAQIELIKDLLLREQGI